MFWKFWQRNKKSHGKTDKYPHRNYFFHNMDTLGGSYHDQATKGYMKNPIVFRCIQEITNAAISVPIKLYGPRDEEILHHPILNLLRKPNIGQSGSEFLANLISYYIMCGNAYAQLSAGEPYEIYALRPDRINIVPGLEGLPSGYEYTVDKQKIYHQVDQTSGLCRVMHWKQFHPLNDWYGFSPLQASGQSIETYNQGKQWNSALLQHACRPSGALVSDSELTDDQYNRIRDQLDQYFAGPSNVGKTFVLEGGLNWTDMSLSPKDMDFALSMQNSAREIAFAIGVPPMLIGLPGDNTYNNQKEARIALWEQTIIPTLVSLCSLLTTWLPAHFKHANGYRIAIDVDKIPILSDRRQPFWNNLIEAVRNQIISPEEARLALGYSQQDRQSSKANSPQKKFGNREIHLPLEHEQPSV